MWPFKHHLLQGRRLDQLNKLIWVDMQTRWIICYSVRVVCLDLLEITIKNAKLNLLLPEIQLHVHQWAPVLFGMYNVTNVYRWWWWHQCPWKCSSALKRRLEDRLVLNPNASCALWAFIFFIYFFFFLQDAIGVWAVQQGAWLIVGYLL